MESGEIVLFYFVLFGLLLESQCEMNIQNSTELGDMARDGIFSEELMLRFIYLPIYSP